MENYEPLKILGEGSFGKVYLMKHKGKKKLVCVKVLKIKNIPHKEREACCLEVNLLQRLTHPNIVGYEESFLSPKKDSLFIVMQYCDGGDLNSRVKAAGGQLFAESKVLHWFVQMALGLQHMHANRILHRDLKSQNIFLLGNGRLVLGDLGISKVLDTTSDFADTLIGTPYYMSPEIFQNKPYNYKSDIWALGCVLYEMTTLHHPFDATNLNGLALKVIKGRYVPIDDRYSTHLRDLISEMLSTDPARRPALEDILRKSFIKRHIQEFFKDIMSRPSAAIGEGTMAVKVAMISAAQQGATPALDPEGESLRAQLEELELHSVIARALNPPEPPTSARGALRMAREQTSALHREEERKQIVEETLAKLRAEREERIRRRSLQDGGLGGASRANRDRVVPPVVKNGGAMNGLRRPPSPATKEPRALLEPTPTAAPKPSERRHSSGNNAAIVNDPRMIALRRATEEEKKRRERKSEIEQQQRGERRDSQERDKDKVRPVKGDEGRKREEGEDRNSARGGKSPRVPPSWDEEAGRIRAPVVPSRSPIPPLAQASQGQGQGNGHHRRRSTNESGSSAGERPGEEDQQPQLTPREKLRILRQNQLARAAEEAEALLSARGRDSPAPSDPPRPLSGAGRSHRTPSPDLGGPSGGGARRLGSASPPVQDEPWAKVSPRGSKLEHDDTPSLMKREGQPTSGPRGPSESKSPRDRDNNEEEEEIVELLNSHSLGGDGYPSSDEDEDLQQREEELQMELEAATQRCEEIKKTLVSTKSFIHREAARKGSKEEEDPVAHGAGAHPRALETIDASSYVDDKEEEEEQEEYKDDYEDYESDEEGGAAAPKKEAGISNGGVKRDSGPIPTPRSGDGWVKDVDSSSSHRPSSSEPRGRPYVPPLPESKAVGGGGITPRSGRLEDRVRETRALCIKAIGEELYWKAYTVARQLQNSSDHDLDLHETQKRQTLAPILGDRLKVLDLINQIIFMEDSMK